MKRSAWFTLALCALSMPQRQASSEPHSAPAVHSCEALANLSLPNVKITQAVRVEAGAFTPPSSFGVSPAVTEAYKRLPSFCRVMATLTPSADSDIKMELW